MYDAIIVGSRCAGSPLAMLLASAGFSVLLADRSTFPSDIMSTHYIHPQAVDCLRNWGLLDKVLDSNCPPIRNVTRGFGPQATTEPILGSDGEPAFGLCPRRIVIDKILVDAAVAAGAELREGFHVNDVSRDGSGAVTGIVGRDSAGSTVTEIARITIGADGLHSRIARLVRPEEYNRFETVLCAYYSYFSGLQMDGMEFYGGPGAGTLMFPTNDARVCVAAARPRSDFERYRSGIEQTFFETVGTIGFGVLDRLKAARREERFIGSGDLPQYFYKPFGPGWALVGDAGLHIDPTMGLGITKAFSEVSMLAPALIAGLSGEQPMQETLARYHDQRDSVWVPMAQQNVAMACGIAGAQPPTVVSWSEHSQPIPAEAASRQV